MKTTNLIYLAGPIAGLTYGESVDWREKIIYGLPDHIRTISPMRGMKHLEELTAGKPLGTESYDMYPMSTGKAINHRDYWDVQRCDVMFVNLLGATKVSIGTVMEIAWARAFGKPVILVMEDEGNVHEHVMLTFPASYRVNNLKMAVNIMNVICSDDLQLANL